MASIECFCEAVCWLVVGRYISQFDSGVLDVLAGETVLDVDMLSSSVMLRTFGEFDYRLAVRI